MNCKITVCGIFLVCLFQYIQSIQHNILRIAGEFLRALAGAVSNPVFDDADTAGQDVGRVDLAQFGIGIGEEWD